MTSYPAVGRDLIAKFSVDEAISNSVDEPTLVRNNQNTNLNNHSLSNITHITLNSEPTDDKHVTAKAYVDSLSENKRNRRDFFQCSMIKILNLIITS